MRLNELTPHFFRAFGNSAPIVFSEKITIFYGGNGSGKSSFAEALEWLFYGYTKRRRKGDNFSKNEYKDSYINKGCPTGDAPYVEANVTFRDGTAHILKRIMNIDDRGRIIETDMKLFVDENEVSDFLSLDVSSDAQCPVVVQHGIQDFIHARPIDRYRTISEALGLADLTKFKDVLEKAKNQFKNNPPQKVIEAKQKLKQASKDLEEIQLNDIAKRWQKKEIEVDENVDLQTITSKAKQLTDSLTDSADDLLKDVKERQLLEMSKLFDVTPYRPLTNQDTILQEMSKKVIDLAQRNDDLYATASELANVMVATYSEKHLEFWRQGLALVKPSAEISDSQNEVVECPFCGENTLSASKLAEIHSRSTSGQELDEKRQKLRGALTFLQNVVIAIHELLPRVGFDVIPTEKVQTLKKMFSRGEKQLDEFVKYNKECVETLAEIKSRVAELIQVVKTLQSQDFSPEESLTSVESVVILVRELTNLFPKTDISLRKYSKTFTEFQPILQRELSDEKTVAIFTSLINLLSVKPHFDLVIRARNFDADILKSQQQADGYILERQREMVQKREQDILVWYGLLSPNPDVKFTGLIPGKDEYNLKATAFGRELNAAASLSQSQLNCLGLSVYIPSIVAPEAPFEFIVFDDPVQAMDDEHHESFLMKVVPELLGNRNRQVIVLTHLKPTADRLRSLNYERSPIFYKFDKLTSSGPRIKEHIVFKDEIDQIRDLSGGDEENRKLAVDRIRVLCEIIMREAHIKINNNSMPDNLQNPRQMFQAFRKLNGVTVGHAKNLEDTIGWSDKSHHTDTTWQVPNGVDIELHIERLQSIIGSLGLRSDRE